MKSELILHSAGSDTSNWKTLNGGTVPTKTVTINSKSITTITTTDLGQWNNTYLDKEIPVTGHYMLNVEMYHTERSMGYWSMEFLQSPLTKKDDDAYNCEVCYTHETEEWQDTNNNAIITGDTYKIPINTWTLLSFDINNGKITVTYNDTIVDLGTLSNPVYFSMRTWYNDGNIMCGNIELRQYEE